ncbi:aminopeptidase O isoform X1 [Zootoca vivipara]|uniref:aminopeptidase O isoform X1 n=1 Tax=Zootoca vivipara TaxID=8524 RepID=UPI00293B9FC4|nr:aminopeptidase O isoform X1 [Zootoca vivipara]XP_060136085.1 aminopeptidase O isoform X1 [Zootoca vivipara]XP_060136086.1 aminopeptidase O isoform X1 [Zootoca vivipara]
MKMELDITKDDLPLMANTSHMLVRHYVLDLDVDLKSHVIGGTIVLFFDTDSRCRKRDSEQVEEACHSQSDGTCYIQAPEACYVPVPNASACSTKSGCNDFAVCSKGENDTSDKNGSHGNKEQASGISSSKNCCDIEIHGSEDFLLVLDCCDLSVLKVEEVDVAVVPGIEKFTSSAKLMDASKDPRDLRNQIVHELVTLPADRWKEQLQCYRLCSQAPACGELLFVTGTWSLEIRKAGVQLPKDFPHAIRICYKTKPEGKSLSWTTDQCDRPCVYTAGSPINNRALFPCQEPPVAMSTWQAAVRADACFVVLMSGENVAEPTESEEGVLNWFYYVTMPMPASTFTIAAGCWAEVKRKTCATDVQRNDGLFPLLSKADVRLLEQTCGHLPYPCRFQDPAATSQVVIPHRVFAPQCLEKSCKEVLLQLIPQCLSAAYGLLGTHPFSRLDVLIVPPNFSSLGMASPHIIFMSQSTLSGGSHLCGTRLCHEIAHAWFGLAIGARDWTEEWLSEGFATHLEDAFWSAAQQLSADEAKEQQDLKAVLRWQRLRDEVQNSEGDLQVLRPKKENTGKASESGASVIKHGLNAEKVFMQVHYLKGYFLLRSFAGKAGEAAYFAFLKKFVWAFHGQLILSQDFLHLLLEDIPQLKRYGLSVENIFQKWLDCTGIPKPLLEESQAWQNCRLAQQVNEEVVKWIQVNQRARKSSKRKRGCEEVGFQKLSPDQLVLLLECLLEKKTLCSRTLECLQKTYHLREQDAEVRHRWCELVIKHKYTAGYVDVEKFLKEDQAMGVYLYGELMVNEDAKQQEIARKSFAATRDQMDASSATVVAEMLF